MSKPRKKPLRTNSATMATIITLVTRFQPLSSTPLPIRIPSTRPGTALPIISCAAPPKIVAQKPDFLPASIAASQKITGITVFTSRFAAGTSTLTAVTCSASGTDEAVRLRKATTIMPMMPQEMAIFFGSCSVSPTLRFFSISAAAPQLGIMRWSTSWVKEPAATEEAQALKKKPRPKEKWEAGSPSQEFSSPRVRNAPIPCVVGA